MSQKLLFTIGSIWLMLTPFVASGVTYKVSIQCENEGPVYQGTMDFDLNVANWGTNGNCTPEQTVPYTWTRYLMAPSFVLTYQGNKYVGENNMIGFIYTTQNCDPKSLQFAYGASQGVTVMNAATGETSTITFPFDAQGYLRSTFQINQCTGLMTK